MPVICYQPDHINQMVHHAQAALPQEACGLVAGIGDDVYSIFPITNSASNPGETYDMQPDELLHALKQIDALGLDVVGVYHSHPQAPPIPSLTDIQHATRNLPGKIHTIISLQGGHARLQAWYIGREETVSRAELIIGKQKYTITRPHTLSNWQKTAIALTIFLSALVVLAISVYLLPPAPTIP